MSSSKNPLSGEKARAILAEFPDASSHMLARMLYERHPRIYPSQDAARCAIRNQRGALGTMNRKAKGLMVRIKERGLLA